MLQSSDHSRVQYHKPNRVGRRLWKELKLGALTGVTLRHPTRPVHHRMGFSLSNEGWQRAEWLTSEAGQLGS